MNPITPQFEDKVREAMKTFTEDINPAPDALVQIQSETRSNQTRKAYVGGALAIAAVLVAAVATFAAVRDTPAKKKVDVSHNGNAPTSAPASPSTNATPTTVSPVGKLVPSGGIVAGMADGSIALVDASYGVQRTLVPASVGLSTDSVAVNADGTKLFAFHGADPSGRPGCMDLVQIDLATDKSTTLGSFSSFAVSGDGTHLATLTHPVAGTGVCDIFNSPDAKVVVRDLATGTEQTLNPGDGSDLQTVTLSPDGTKLALNYSVGQGRVVIYDLTTSPATVQRTVQVPGTSIDITAMAWTDEGLFVAATPHQGLGDLSDAGYLFDPTTGAKLRTLYELRSSPIGLGSTQQLAPLASGLVEIVVDRNGEHRVEQLSGTMSAYPAGITTKIASLVQR